MSREVPEGWSETNLDNLLKFRRGTTYTASELSDDSNNHPLYITMKSFNVGGGYSEKGDKYYSSPYKTRQVIKENELLIANTDVTLSCDILGCPLLLPHQKLMKDVLFSHHVTAVAIQRNVDKVFLFHLLCSSPARSMMKSCGRGTTVKMLDVKEIGKLSFQFPPLPEQKKIAAILTSVDEVIENLQKQIDKLQDLKKAAMNELLTRGIGHIEFKDSELGRIPKGWEIIQVGALGKFYGGLTSKTSKDFGSGEPFITYMQVFAEETSNKELVNFVNVSEDEKQNRVKFGDVLFTVSSETPEDVGMTSVFLDNDWNPFLNSFCFGIRHKQEHSLIDPYFSKFLFRGAQFRKDIYPLAQGSTRFNLSKTSLKNLSIVIPPIPEQKKIAATLASFNNQVSVSRKKLCQTQSLKKSLMQDLLTGKVRVQLKGLK